MSSQRQVTSKLKLKKTTTNNKNNNEKNTQKNPNSPQTTHSISTDGLKTMAENALLTNVKQLF